MKIERPIYTQKGQSLLCTCLEGRGIKKGGAEAPLFRFDKLKIRLILSFLTSFN
jgi:hypothetical protein